MNLIKRILDWDLHDQMMMVMVVRVRVIMVGVINKSIVLMILLCMKSNIFIMISTYEPTRRIHLYPSVLINFLVVPSSFSFSSCPSI